MKKLFFSFVLFTVVATAQTVALQSFATGFSSPVEITSPPNDSRLFVVQKGGLIRILNSNGTVNSTPFLTVTGLSSGGEQGLLGLAFHPNYATNGMFFINYTNTAGDTIIARYTVSANPDVANATGTIIMTIDQPFSNHNGGSLKFGPDGYLYIGMGDGGSGGDPDGYGQNMTVNASFPSRVFLGKMLRIDPNTSLVPPYYSIPPTNPYVGQTGKEEIWARGLRNPWKFSFNRLNGDLWIADVGQNAVEEINKTASPLPNSGINYGWRCYEGNSTYLTTGCDPMNTMTFPVAQYTHGATSRCSITGGYFYTGSTYPNFANKYFFADYCTAEIGYVSGNGGTITWALDSTGFVTTFGEDRNGELYVATSGGTIFKLIDSSLGLNDFNKKGLSFYPNPAKTEIFIKNSTETTINKVSIFDLTGKLMQKNEVNEGEISSMTIATLARGMYILSAQDTNGNQYQSKLVVE